MKNQITKYSIPWYQRFIQLIPPGAKKLSVACNVQKV
ncbi:uncharacterized protein J3R85_006534 [Psidium guajava]|nr:uncharacterized protein J3R85_006534 [Psidium guajava]